MKLLKLSKSIKVATKLIDSRRIISLSSLNILVKDKLIQYNMELHIYLKGKDEPTIFKGERIDTLDIELQGKKYKQIRYFRKGISKSQYISVDLIKKMKAIENEGDKN